MGALTAAELRDALADGGEVVVWSEEAVDAVAARGRRRACTSSSTPGWAGSGRATPSDASARRGGGRARARACGWPAR